MQGQMAQSADKPPAVSVRLEVLAKRADFLRAAPARRQGTGGFRLQADQHGRCGNGQRQQQRQ